MKTDKALRRIASMRRNDHQPVAEYVAVLPPDLRNAVLDSLTLPECRALEHLLKARQERRRMRAIEDERIHTAHEAAAAKEEAAREAKLSGFVCELKAQRLNGDAARFAAASRYTLSQLVRLLSPEEREACRSYRKDEILTSRARELLGCSLTELNRWTKDGRLPTLRTKTVSGLFPKTVTARTFVHAEVVRVVGRTEDWRKQDSVRKAYRRHGLRAVSSSPT
jgi:hypothetical protein